MAVPTMELPDGSEMPVLGLGTWQMQGETCVEAVRTALDLGYTHIDTAEFYDNEDEIGEAITEADRTKLFITSKVWPKDLTYSKVRKAVSKMLDRLGTGYLDLLLLHWPKEGQDLKEIFRAFKTLQHEGKVRNVGVSNFMPHHLEKARKLAEETGIAIAMNQVEYHPHLNQETLREYCKKHGIPITAYSPIAQGGVLDDPVLAKIGDAHGKTPAQVSLRWLLQKGLVVIPKASSEGHLRENMDVFDFELTGDEMERIDTIGKKDRIVDPGWIDFGKD